MGKKPILSIPQKGKDFTAEWFNEFFQPEYGAAVLNVDREVIGTGVGFVGEVHRCFLQWDASREDLPSSVIVKVPSKLPLTRLKRQSQAGDFFGSSRLRFFFQSEEHHQIRWMNPRG